MELPGVGPKMAYLVMNVGWGCPGICGRARAQDRRAHGAGCLLWRTPPADAAKTRTPEDTRVYLESWLPEEEWVEINPLLVGHGYHVHAPRAEGGSAW